MSARAYENYRRVEVRGRMHSWLGRMPSAFAWILFLGTVVAAPPSGDEIRCWIRQLDSHDFAVCAEASRKLADSGDAAVETLLRSAGNADAEVSWRATGVLEQIALHGNEITLRRITAGLKDLTRRGRSGLEAIVDELQTREARLQRERAVATIRSLGGRFEGDEKATPQLIAKSLSATQAGTSAVEPPPAIPSEPVSGAALSIPAPVGFVGDAYASPEFVNGTESNIAELVLTIDEQWRGGDAGLAALLDLGSIVRLRIQRAPLTDTALEHVAAIPQLQSLELDGCHFSAEALRRLRQRQPRVVVDGK